jgi:hypothetical protein
MIYFPCTTRTRIKSSARAKVHIQHTAYSALQLASHYSQKLPCCQYHTTGPCGHGTAGRGTDQIGPSLPLAMGFVPLKVLYHCHLHLYTWELGARKGQMPGTK